MMDFSLLPVVLKAFLAFAATNIDDIFLLALWFAQPDRVIGRVSIVAGQYLGFIGLVGISLLGLLGSLVIPQTWIGLLGLLPMGIGAHKLWSGWKEEKQTSAPQEDEALPTQPNQQARSMVWQVAAITFANGGDNIGIYTPLFASSGPAQVVVILLVFFMLVAVWCWLGYQVTRQGIIKRVLARHSDRIVPFVLIGLGLFILYESESYRLIFSY